MKKLQKTNELLWLLGVLFVALGVAICSKADLGVSMIAAPAFVLQEAVSALWSGLSVGVTEYIIQGMLLIIMCLIVRRADWRYLLAFAVAVIYGYVLDLFLFILSDVSFATLPLRWLMLIVGDCITALGVACFFRTGWPLQVYELFVAELARTFRLSTGKVKWGFDIALLALSLLLAFALFGDAKSFAWGSITGTSFHSIGLGTLVTTAINSPIITAFGKLLDKLFDPTPLFPRVYEILKRD